MGILLDMIGIFLYCGSKCTKTITNRWSSSSNHNLPDEIFVHDNSAVCWPLTCLAYSIVEQYGWLHRRLISVQITWASNHNHFRASRSWNISTYIHACMSARLCLCILGENKWSVNGLEMFKYIPFYLYVRWMDRKCWKTQLTSQNKCFAVDQMNGENE